MPAPDPLPPPGRIVFSRKGLDSAADRRWPAPGRTDARGWWQEALARAGAPIAGHAA